MADDLDTPLAPKKASKTRKLPFELPHIFAGLLGCSIVVVAIWTVVAEDPYGGEPIAVVRTRGDGQGDRSVAAPAVAKPESGAGVKTAAKPAEPAPPPGSKVITITDGTSGKTQQVTVPPRPGDKIAKAAADPKLLETSRHGQIPKVAADGARSSSLYAHPMAAGGKNDAPKIAIVIGGLGVSASVTEDALTKLPGAVTLAFAPYGNNLDELAARARASEHEVLLQAPMEPFDYPDNDPGPQTLLTTLTADQNIDRLHWLMARMQGYVGIASLMGARFTASGQALAPVLREIAQRGLMYVDDGTSTRSVAGQIAGSSNLPFAKADVAIDGNETDQALARLELAAKERGSAVAFANASPATITRIAEWSKKVQSRGFLLVPISMVAQKPKSS